MRHQQHGLAVGVRAREPRENVLHAPGNLIPRTDARGCLYLRPHAEGGQLREDVVANAIVVGHAHGMRPNGDLLDVVHRTLSRKHGIRGGCGHGTGRTVDAGDREGAEEEQRQGSDDAVTHVR